MVHFRVCNVDFILNFFENDVFVKSHLQDDNCTIKQVASCRYKIEKTLGCEYYGQGYQISEHVARDGKDTWRLVTKPSRISVGVSLLLIRLCSGVREESEAHAVRIAGQMLRFRLRLHPIHLKFRSSSAV